MANIFSKANLLARTYSRKSSYGGGWGTGLWLFNIFFWLALYAYSAITLMFIAKKTNTPNAWMAWIPFLNMYLMCKAAGKSIIWFVLLLIPFVNIVAIVVLWCAIAERLGRPSWWGILMLVPIANFVIMGMLAFSGGPGASKPVAAVPAPKKPALAPSGKGFCPGCGTKIGSGDKFCPDCGSKT